MNNLLQRFHCDKPRCLENFTLATTEHRHSSVMPFSDEFVHRMVGCHCGGDRFYVWAYPVLETVGIFRKRTRISYSGPIDVQCQSCETRARLFDPTQHGWSAEKQRLQNGYMTQSPNPQLRRCFNVAGRVAVCYSYQGLENYQSLADEGGVKLANFFTTFEVTVSVDGLQTFSAITAQECT